jgi:transcription elongation factor GreA-like protein
MRHVALSFFVLFAIASVVANVFWYRAKLLLRARGYPVSWLNQHWRDRKNLAEYAASTPDPEEQRAAALRLARIKLWLSVSAGCFIIFFVTWGVGVFVSK